VSNAKNPIRCQDKANTRIVEKNSVHSINSSLSCSNQTDNHIFHPMSARNASPTVILLKATNVIAMSAPQMIASIPSSKEKLVFAIHAILAIWFSNPTFQKEVNLPFPATNAGVYTS
jgi:hypothetical protein